MPENFPTTVGVTTMPDAQPQRLCYIHRPTFPRLSELVPFLSLCSTLPVLPLRRSSALNLKLAFACLGTSLKSGFCVIWDCQRNFTRSTSWCRSGVDTVFRFLNPFTLFPSLYLRLPYLFLSSSLPFPPSSSLHRVLYRCKGTQTKRNQNKII